MITFIFFSFLLCDLSKYRFSNGMSSMININIMFINIIIGVLFIGIIFWKFIDIVCFQNIWFKNFRVLRNFFVTFTFFFIFNISINRFINMNSILRSWGRMVGNNIFFNCSISRTRIRTRCNEFFCCSFFS
jgi:hypothetical protein